MSARVKGTVFKVNGTVKYEYVPGFKGVPEFGVYVLGEPEPSEGMLEEVAHCLESLILDMQDDEE